MYDPDRDEADLVVSAFVVGTCIILAVAVVTLFC